MRRLVVGDRILIGGAGPAGLTAGYLLARRGYRSCVVEGDAQVGGLARTVRYKDFRFDIGGHRFFTKIPEVAALWDEVLGADLIDVPRLSRIHYRGKYFRYPLNATEALLGLGPWEAARVVLSYIHTQLRPSLVEDTFEQWVSNRFGHRLFQIFFKTYTEKVWGVPCSEIRAEWAAQRIQGLSLVRAILAATALQKRPNGIRSLIHQFKYPRLGPGQMWQRCADLMVGEGGELLLNHEITSFELAGNCIVSAGVKTPDGERRFEAEHFISTMPLRSLVRALGSSAPDAVKRSAEGLSYRDFILVALILDKPRLFPDNWIYCHTPGIRVGRVQNFNNWSSALVPDPTKTCLGMEYFCFQGDALWQQKDQDLVDMATRELDTLGLARGAKVIDANVVRMPKAYPIYDGAYRRHLDIIRSFLDTIPNLHTIGRNGMHKYNNQDHSMYTAMLAVANLQGATHDLWAVNDDLDYHEEQLITNNAATEAVVPTQPTSRNGDRRRPRSRAAV